jgi:hypothetical protein
LAWAAGPPSPAKPFSPVPAMVVMMLVAGSIWRMRWLAWSEISRLPAGSYSTLAGRFRIAIRAGPLSPP